MLIYRWDKFSILFKRFKVDCDNVRWDRFSPWFVILSSITDIEWPISTREQFLLRVGLVPVQRDRFSVSIPITFRSEKISPQRQSCTNHFWLYNHDIVVLLSHFALYPTFIGSYCCRCSECITGDGASSTHSSPSSFLHPLTSSGILRGFISPQNSAF